FDKPPIVASSVSHLTLRPRGGISRRWLRARTGSGLSPKPIWEDDSQRSLVRCCPNDRIQVPAIPSLSLAPTVRRCRNALSNRHLHYSRRPTASLVRQPTGGTTSSASGAGG